MEELLEVFKALSDGTRLRVIKLLEHGELCVCDLVASLAMSQQSINNLRDQIAFRIICD